MTETIFLQCAKIPDQNSKVLLPCAQGHCTCPFGVKLYSILASKTNKSIANQSRRPIRPKSNRKALPNCQSDPSTMLTSCGIEIEPRLHCRPRKKQKQRQEGKDLNKESEAVKKEVGIKTKLLFLLFQPDFKQSLLQKAIHLPPISKTYLGLIQKVTKRSSSKLFIKSYWNIHM